MAFVKEYISEEDQKKFGHNSTWAIDRERGMYLFGSGLNRDKQMIFELRRLSDGMLIIKAKADEISITITPPNQSIGFAGDYVQRYEIYDIFTTDSFERSPVDHSLVLQEAIAEYCSGKPGKKYPNIKVETIFLNHIGGAK